MSQSPRAALTKNFDFTPEEFLDYERNSSEKHEFINGAIKAMAGASETHNIISGNLAGEIYAQLKNTNCRGFASDLRVKAASLKKTNYYYPDLVIVCGKREFDDGQKDVLINPNVVIEILSKSTHLKDRNEKLESYFALQSVTDYVLVSQDEMRIEHYSRLDSENWKIKILTLNTQHLNFENFDCSVSLGDIYNEVEFADTSPQRKLTKKNKKSK